VFSRFSTFWRASGCREVSPAIDSAGDTDYYTTEDEIRCRILPLIYPWNGPLRKYHPIVGPLPSNRTKAKTLRAYCRCQAAPEQTPKKTLDAMWMLPSNSPRTDPKENATFAHQRVFGTDPKEKAIPLMLCRCCKATAPEPTPKKTPPLHSNCRPSPSN
jgi:hypothetical protein